MPNKYLSKISSPIKASIIYTICNFFIKGLNIITLPIFTRIMTPYELGIVTTFTSWTTLLSVIANLSLNSGSFNIAMLEFKQNREGYQSSVLGLSTISSVMLIILYLIFFEEINQILGLGTWLVILMLISFVFKPAMDFWLLKQRYEYKYKLSSLVSLSTTFCATIFSIFAVLTTRNSEISSYLAEIRLYSSNLIIICVSVFIYVLIFIRGKTFYNKVYWRFALTTSLPLMIHTLAKHILDVSDKLMISNMIGKSATGIYGILYSLSSVSLIIWNSINASLVPYMFEKLGQKHEYRKIQKVVYPLLIIYAVFCILLALCAPEILQIITTKEYYEAVYLMPPIVAGIYLTSLYNIFANVLLYHKKTMVIMGATVCAAVLNIVMNYLFLGKFGYIAAAYTTLLSYLILSLMQYFSMRKVHKQRIFDSKMIYFLSVSVILICLSCNLIYKFTLIRYIIILLLVVVLFVFRKKLIGILKNIKG